MFKCLELGQLDKGNTTMKKAIGYIRVSTDGQVESGLSLEAQRKKIEAYASLKDLELIEIIEDAGISAKNLNRPGIKRLMELGRKKEIDAVIIAKLDRMFRNTIDALETSEILNKRGVALHSIEESLDTQSAIGGFFFTMLAALAEMERKLIGERTRTALNQKKARNEYCGGHVPYGYRLENGKLIEEPTEKAIIEKMRVWRKDGRTLQAICNSLNGEGIASRGGGKWRISSIHKILKAA